jgi:hypothetical protein
MLEMYRYFKKYTVSALYSSVEPREVAVGQGFSPGCFRSSSNNANTHTCSPEISSDGNVDIYIFIYCAVHLFFADTVISDVKR